MINDLQHELRIPTGKDDRSRQRFVASLRAHVLGPMAETMRTRYKEHYEPAYEKAHGKAPEEGADVHDLMLADEYFRYYSSVRYNAQEMAFRSVIPMIDKNLDELNERAAKIREEKNATAVVDPNFEVPRNVTAIDVHLAPGSYHTEYMDNDVAAGAVYDNAINVFAFNQMGLNMDDIGHTMSNYVRIKFPDFKPEKILDCGCSIGHNSVPWKQTFPDAEVTAIDVSAPCVRYAAARAASFGADVKFMQMNATKLDFPDNHFDVVFSSMFLHELPLKDIRAYLKEANRVLKPGGLLLTMELPPNSKLEAYDQFYLDWDCYYNYEPYYKPFRDQDYRELCTTAGFPADNFFEFQAPRYTYMPEEEFKAIVEAGSEYNERSGVLGEGLLWYGFGSWKYGFGSWK
ncbi:MAG: class I SAM-dependent methyltransferase [Gammaproteobacteria bacterium]|jgi:ubiquinone/menaquinone biosynthesis C-methylase UbiE|nr:class I SAM-dependent methyltransferase [Gammaproteobacteria bacterium]